jgi:hypothetical protein
MSRHSKDKASRMSEVRDAHAEWLATRNPEALKRRQAAYLSGSPEDTRRAGEFLATQSFNEGQDGRDRMRRAKCSGWKRKG